MPRSSHPNRPIVLPADISRPAIFLLGMFVHCRIRIRLKSRYPSYLIAIHEALKRNAPKDIKVGMQLHGKDSGGHVVRPIAKEIKDDTVLLDFNHPLAGKTLFLDVEVGDVR